MKKEKNETAQSSAKEVKNKSTSGGGKDKNGGGLPASQLKGPGDASKSGRSGGKGA